MRRLCGVVCGLVTSICQLGMSGLTNPPSPNIDYALAFSPQAGGLLMHGGWCQPDWMPRSSSWLLTEMGWEPGPDGPAMMHHSGALLTYNPLQGKTLLVVPEPQPGKAGMFVSETWAYDGTDWSMVASGTPSNAFRAGMAYDAARSNVVLLTTDSETWIWNGTAWTPRYPAHSPTPARGYFTMGYDPLRERAVIYSGEADEFPSATYPIDTWEWDGVDWQQFVPVPEPELAVAMMAALVGVLRRK